MGWNDDVNWEQKYKLNPKHDPDVKAIIKAAQTKYGGTP